MISERENRSNNSYIAESDRNEMKDLYKKVDNNQNQ